MTALRDPGKKESVHSIGAKLFATAVFVILNGFFVAAEFALVKCSSHEIRRLADEGNRRAQLAARILDDLGFYLSACQFGITVASLVLGWLAEPAVAELLVRGLAAYDVSIANQDWVHGVALLIALTTITVIHMVLGEQAPKIFALQRADATSLNVAYPLRFFVLIFKPLIWAVSVASDRVVMALGAQAGVHEHGEALGRDELRALLVASTHAGQIGQRYGKFADNALQIADLEVRNVMVPRVDAVILSQKATDDENAALLCDSGHTRFPLCKDDLDTVIGIVHVKDAARALMKGTELDLAKIARRPIFVPESQPLPAFMGALQRAGQQCAVVVDEHGTAVGLGFLEDAVEEIIGPIRDEFDKDVEQPRISEIAPDRFEASGAVPMREVTRQFGFALDEDTETLGGYLTAKVGALPRVGDAVTVGDYRLQVKKMSARRVALVLIERVPTG